MSRSLPWREGFGSIVRKEEENWLSGRFPSGLDGQTASPTCALLLWEVELNLTLAHRCEDARKSVVSLPS